MSSRATTSESRKSRSDGDDVLEQLFERHHPSLWRLGLRMTGDAATADDLVQETFVRAMSGRLPVSLDTAEAWMVRILVNLCRDLYRWRKVRHDHAGTVEAVTSDRAAAGNPESQAMARVTVEKALRKLPARRRAVLVMHDLEGLEPRRIGELLGLRPATVRGYLATARREMKELIERSER